MKRRNLRDHPSVEELCARAQSADPEAVILQLCADLRAEAPEVPTDLEVLASFRSIRPPEVVAMDEAGSIHFDGDNFVVRLNANDSRRRRRFTLAHEIVHTFLGTADARRTPAVDRQVGKFERSNPEEYLCDLGAAELLLPTAAFVPACGDRPSVDRVSELGEIFDASLEATARRVVTTVEHEAHLVVLEPGYTKAEEAMRRRRLNQMTLGNMDRADPVPKLRVRYAVSNTDDFIPPNKSVEETSPLAACIVASAVDCFSETGLLPGRRHQISAQYLPYEAGGQTHHRVLALLYSR
jgi:Zn-dependent peptidase ImmA (M78 family)